MKFFQENVRDTRPETFNADELGLFFNLLPEKSIVHRTESYHGGKRSKEQITVLLCCNMDGSEKLKPLVIGKSANPRCFKNMKSFPCEYKHQNKAWMSGTLFIEWLIKLDRQVGVKHRNIILFIDRCPAHPTDLGFLKNVCVLFLPPNATSMLKPLDIGIIRVMKHYYRKMMVRRLLNLIDRKIEKNMKINIYQAMHFLVVSSHIFFLSYDHYFNEVGTTAGKSTDLFALLYCLPFNRMRGNK